MTHFIRRDAAHGGAYSGLGGSLGLVQRDQRAPSFSHAAFDRVFWRDFQQGPRYGLFTLHGRDWHAEATGERLAGASVAARVASGARERAQ